MSRQCGSCGSVVGPFVCDVLFAGQWRAAYDVPQEVDSGVLPHRFVCEDPHGCLCRQEDAADLQRLRDRSKWVRTGSVF